ncbi:MAG: orotate phosphoribosyltransferase, partial [Oscillospiraceae bacterium]
PVVASAVCLDLPNYEVSECPLCKEGKIEVVKPGSRKFAK